MSLELAHAAARNCLVPLLCISCVAACSKDPCFESTKGKKYHINVVERWDQNSQYPGWSGGADPCPSDFDLVPGSGFDVQITDFNPDASSCACGMGEIITAPPGWDWQRVGWTDRCVSNFLSITLDATSANGCSGQVMLGISSSSVPSSIPIAGMRPESSLLRTYHDTGGDAGVCRELRGAAGCYDDFVISIEER